MRQSLDDITLAEGNNELNVQMVPIVPPLPSIDIVGFNFFFLHAGYYHRAGLTGVMVYPEKVDYIGFEVRNNERVDISGVTVAFRVTDGGEKDISSPVYQWPPPGDPRRMTPPFTVPYDSDWRCLFTFRFDPIEPYDYTAVAEVYVKGELVATSTLDFHPDWPEPPPIKSKVGLSIASLGAIGFNPAMVLEAPRRSLKLVTTNNLDPQAIRARITAAGAGV
ncbi:unnamed protein product, partial [marine sediment metagenome]